MATTRKRDKRFAGMTPAQQRVAIARDALEWLKAGAREEPDHTQGWYDSFAAAIETVKFPPKRETSEPKSMGDNTHAVGAIFGIR